ncbi:MAG: hypothetical protein H8E79_08375 [Desulfobulbaceae bacterium]|uniref:Uncharacterized protein n=1 Tax=Candidatus Desulfatifera sulfidica TaxID=2841691 RepID=A0A8J6N7A6_9BACT|nr:hypothetical protein [Candidatus Desulfatifera sulfidica]
MNRLTSCVTPQGRFIYGIHKPNYTVSNVRNNKTIVSLGQDTDHHPLDNSQNYPDGPLTVEGGDWIFEIPNPFPFRGRTYLNKQWADQAATNPARMHLPPPVPTSFSQLITNEALPDNLIAKLPAALQLTLATCSTDPHDLVQLAELSCDFIKDQNQMPTGLRYEHDKQGRLRARLHNHALFEAVANNPQLPDSYKRVMVLTPGAQGNSEIVGEWSSDSKTHVYEYLRRNSYIAHGHYAANMGEDAVRYATSDLSCEDMHALRHLYYQRSYLRLAEELGIDLKLPQHCLSTDQLETLRQQIVARLKQQPPSSTATLWGWNYGFDYAPSGYRLHASHQQIHQQYALLPDQIPAHSSDPLTANGIIPSYGCGDLVRAAMDSYKNEHDSDFFPDYLNCIRNNQRMDGRQDLEDSLIIWQDAQAMLFVPKAQTSQWELQLMALENDDGTPCGNILEADTAMRQSLDLGILKAQQVFAKLGARMVTSIEFPKRIDSFADQQQYLLYAFLPRLPESPGAFSEAQLRFINGHYPEDFAAICRKQL